MTRATLTFVALLLAGAACLGAGSFLGVPAWWALPVVPGTFLGLVACARRLHRAWVRHRVSLEKLRRGRPAPALRALDLAGRLHAVAAGEAGFTRGPDAVPALERAVLMPWPVGDEGAVLADVARSTPDARRRLVAGLRDLQSEAVHALASPPHVLFPEAHRMLGVMGHPPPLFLAGWRARSAWRRRRERFDPSEAEAELGLRLLLGGMLRASVAVLERGEPGERRDRALSLARFTVLGDRGERPGEGLHADELARYAPELILLLGRRLRELVPGSPLLAVVPGGAARLERAVGRLDHVVRDIVALHREAPELNEHVARALDRLLPMPRARIRKALRRGWREDVVQDRTLQAHLRGLALLAERRPREAEAEFETVLRDGGRLAAQAAYSLAVTRRGLGQRTAAEAALRTCVERREDDPDARMFLARFLSECGDERRARTVYEAAVTRFPDSISLRVAFAQDLLGWGDSGGARRHFETAHRRHPKDPRLAFLAGRARVAAGQPDEAVAPLLRACEALDGGERAEAQFWLLSAYRDQGSHELALELADRLVDGLEAGQERLLDELADYFEEQHEFLRARHAEERARRLRGEW